MKVPAIISYSKATAIAALIGFCAPLGSVAGADPAAEISPISAAELPGTLLHSPTNIKWEPYGKNKTAKVVDSADAPSGQAIQIEVKRKAKEPWDVRMKAPFETDVANGEEVAIYVWMRAAKLPKGTDSGKVDVVLGRNVKPYDTVVVHEVNPTEEWKMYRVSGTAGADFPAADSDMGFNLGKAKQTIEFGPFYAIKTNPTQ